MVSILDIDQSILACYKIGQCKTQTADYCFHHANENVTTIVPLFSNPKNSNPRSVRSLHFTLPRYKIGTDWTFSKQVIYNVPSYFSLLGYDA